MGEFLPWQKEGVGTPLALRRSKFNPWIGITCYTSRDLSLDECKKWGADFISVYTNELVYTPVGWFLIGTTPVI